jgi:transposase
MPAPQAMLIDLRGIGAEFAAVVWSGLCRSFANRRQVAAYGGLAPTPWQSGSVARKACPCLAVVATSAELGAGAMVQGTRQTQ